MMGKVSGGRRISMLLGVPGWRRMKPFRSSVRIIRRTEGGMVEMALDVGRRVGARHVGVGMDEGQVLPLLLGEVRACLPLSFGFRPGLRQGGKARTYVIGRLSQAERDELTRMLGMANTPPASSSGRRFCWRPMLAAGRGDCPDSQGQSLHCRPNEAALRGRQSGTGTDRRASSGADRKLTRKEEACWWRPHAPSAGRPQTRDADTAGRHDGQAHRSTTACRARPCAAGWPRTISSHGAGICGAFPGRWR